MGWLRQPAAYPKHRTSKPPRTTTRVATRERSGSGSWGCRRKPLDVGGGHAQLVGPLVGAGHEVTILGSAESCVTRLRRFVDTGRCSFQVGNVLALPYADEAFDVVVSYRLLSHVTDWRRFLRELARVSRWAVLVDYPEIRSLNCLTPYLFGLKRRVEGNTRHYASFREKDLVRVFQAEGFLPGERFAEFFLPMVVHRTLRQPGVSSMMESFFRRTGLTPRFGSPVILKLVREGARR